MPSKNPCIFHAKERAALRVSFQKSFLLRTEIAGNLKETPVCLLIGEPEIAPHRHCLKVGAVGGAVKIHGKRGIAHVLFLPEKLIGGVAVKICERE